jgi:hypothetical protein
LRLFVKRLRKKTGVACAVRGRPQKLGDEKYEPISIRLNSIALAWAKKEAKKRGVGYQAINDEILLEKAAA